MRRYSSREAAKKLGISYTSLNRYIADDKIPLPPLMTLGAVKARLWSNEDIERVRLLFPKIANGLKLYAPSFGRNLTRLRSAHAFTHNPE